MGSVCGRESEQAPPPRSHPPRVTVEDAGEDARPDTPIPQKAAPAVEQNDAGFTMAQLEIDYPPAALPRPLPGMGLPAWLKLVLRPTDKCAIDQSHLLEVYSNIWQAPRVTDEMLTQLALKICPGAKDIQGGGERLIVWVRWLNAYEAADAFKAGHEAGDARRVSKTRENVGRVMEFLLTVGNGKLPEPKRIANEGGNDTKAPGAAPVVMTEKTDISPAPPLPSATAEKPASAQLTTNLQPPPPARNVDREFEALKTHHCFRSVMCWLQQILNQDADSHIEALDIAHAYDAYRAGQDGWLSIDSALMAEVVLAVFPNTTSFKAKDGSPFVTGLKWQKIDQPVSCTGIPYVTFPEKWRNEAHKLLHIPDPERTKLFLRLFLVHEPQVSMDLPSLWHFYERVFWRWFDTHPHLELREFTETLTKAFRKARMVKVTEGHTVFLGVGCAAKPVPARTMLARKQKRDLHRLQKFGVIDPPKTAFAQKLLEDPLLMRLRRDRASRPIPGSFVGRLRLRAGDPETHAQEPFGDEEPGFPGLSMKRQQVRYKREMKEYQKKMAELQPGLDGGASHRLAGPKAACKPVETAVKEILQRAA